MFKVKASTIDEYFAFDSRRENDLRSIDRIIRGSAPSLKRWFASGTPDGQAGMKMSMIGYGQFTYLVQSSPQPIKWPIVGLALQKNYMSFYCAAKRDGAPFTLEYENRLGSVSFSKTGVINFEAADDFDLAALSEMLQALEAYLERGALVVAYGRLSRPRPKHRG